MDVHNDHCNLFELKNLIVLQGSIRISFLSDTALATYDRHFFLKELLMYGITCLVITQLTSRPLQVGL